MTHDPKFDAEAARQQRLAAALRANLQRRKARDRAASEPPAGPGGPIKPDEPA